MFSNFVRVCRRVGVLLLATCAFLGPANAAPPARPVGSSASEAMAFARQMGVGWNLGNTLEATGMKNATTVRDYETGWGNPVTTKTMVDGIKAAGFRSIRVPVGWSNLIGPAPDYVIDKNLMARVDQVAGYSLDDDLYVIINIHWDGGWIHKFSTDYEGARQKYRAIWRQVAAHFRNRSDHLIFESMNEEGSFDDLWNKYGGKPDHKAEAYDLLNKVNQEFTDLVRASGGNNAKRYLLIAGYGTDIGRTVDPAFQMPRDPAGHSMVSVHYYSPPTFAILEKDANWGKAAYTWGTPADVEAVRRDMLPLKARFLDKGIPVVIGEFGCPTTNKDPDSVVKYIATVGRTAWSLGCVPMLWDPGNFYDRKARRFRDPRIGEAIARIATTPPPASASTTSATLKEAAKGYFYVGVAINREIATGDAGNGRRAPELVAKDIALTTGQFDQISPENDLKWALIHPREGANGYDFGPADAYIDFGVKNHMYIVGHTLVWHGQTPNWVFAGNVPPPPPPAAGALGNRFGRFGYNGPRATRDELLQRMRDHIHTVVGRYKGRVKVWDVVNEALADGPGPNILRNSLWKQIIGPDFIAKAFEYAHEADPDAILRYNDYGLENPVKRQKLITLIKELQAQKVPVMAIGTQTHVSVSSPTLEEEDRALTELETLGLPIHVTELDVNGAQAGQRNTGADIAANAATTGGGLVEEADRRLAHQYADLFTLFRKHKQVKVVTLWGVNDAVSWRADGKPLLFDGNDQPKPAFDAVIHALRGDAPVGAESAANAALAPAQTPDKNFYIFLSFGQSNMEGFPGIEEQDKGPVDPRFQMMAAVDFPNPSREKGHWYPAVPPLARPGNGIGPTDYFGRTLVAHLPAGVRVGVINVAVAGCRIEMFDKDHYATYAETAPSWMKNIITAYGGNPYQRLVDMAKLAQKDGVIKGILLHQGESNTGDKAWPNKVKGIYDNLLRDLDLRAADVPLLAGEVVGADQNGQCASMNAIIDTLPATIPTAYVISSTGCTARPDHLHFTPAGYRELGTRYAQKMLTLLGH